jgi:sugar phosphate isomerase/epimerase
MQRRTFLIRTGGLAISMSVAFNAVGGAPSATGRVGMGTVTLRKRFDEAKLRLLDVPAYYRQRFAVRNLEFWSKHFESLDKPYLEELRARVKAEKAELINVQVDAAYDLASTHEEERQRSLATVRQWIDAAALLGSRAVRINPGKPEGSVEKSIASLKEVNAYCLSKKLPLLTENHFGLEMDPDVHLKIRAGAGPKNVYTLPDFGNYPVETMWTSLERILPFAYVVSAKAVDFDEKGQHVSYDFDRCLQLCERAGFKGLYLVEQWSRKDQPIDPEKIADWMLERVRLAL